MLHFMDPNYLAVRRGPRGGPPPDLRLQLLMLRHVRLEEDYQMSLRRLNRLMDLAHLQLDSLLQRVSERGGGGGGGLSEEVIEKSLKTRAAAGEEDICVVCQDGLSGGEDEMIGVVKCGHEFHASCIKKWLLRKNICPLCKAVAL